MVNLRGFAAAAPIYRAAGHVAVIPCIGKKPVPRGVTGYARTDPTDALIQEWSNNPFWRDENTAIRAMNGDIGLDFDAHGTKTGGETKKEAERLWGLLPPAWRSTSKHNDPISGHLWFTVPDDYRAVPLLGFPELNIGHVDVLQPWHRYGLCWPSIHEKTGDLYMWFDPDGNMMPEGFVPPASEKQPLPDAWLEGMRHTEKTRERVRKTMGYDPEVHEQTTYDVAAALTSGVPSARVSQIFTAAMQELRNA